MILKDIPKKSDKQKKKLKINSFLNFKSFLFLINNILINVCNDISLTVNNINDLNISTAPSRYSIIK